MLKLKFYFKNIDLFVFTKKINVACIEHDRNVRNINSNGTIIIGISPNLNFFADDEGIAESGM